MTYDNKIHLFKKFNNYDASCNICFQTNILNIDLNCGHEICINCYKPDMKCYYNWCSHA